MDTPNQHAGSGSTISTLLHDRINPKDCQVLFLGDSGFLQFFRVVSRDYGTPRGLMFRDGFLSFFFQPIRILGFGAFAYIQVWCRKIKTVSDTLC